VYTVKYLEEVECDIIKAKQWYNNQEPELEKRFSKNIEEAIHKITRMPTSYSIRYKNVRIAHPRIFPYNIHYYIDKENSLIVIIGIIFNKRKDALNLKR